MMCEINNISSLLLIKKNKKRISKVANEVVWCNVKLYSLILMDFR
jgi:hypothetical protein